MRLRRSTLACVLALLATLGAPPAHAQPTTLVIGQPADADSVDPHKVTAVVAVERLYNLYDTLVNLDFDMRTITPGLAESWTISPDGRTYTFVLKSGVKFHSGKPLTARDVKFSFDRWRDPATASLTRSRVTEIEEVVAKDDRTVIVKLKQRSNYLLFNLASGFASIVNPEAIAKHGANYGTLAVDGTGPFKFKEWALRDRFVVERNAAYTWGPPMFKNRGPAKLERVVWRIVPDDALRLLELEKGGGLDVSRWIAFAELPRLRKNPALRVVDYTVGYVVYLGFNLARDVVQDVRVRRAVNYAIRKEPIVNDVFFGVGATAAGPVSPIVSGAWKEVGIRVEPVLLDEAALWGRLYAGEHTAIALGHPHSNADEILYGSFHSKPMNAFSFADDTVDQLLDEGRVTSDRKRWHEVYAEIQKRVIDSAVWVPLWHPGRAMTMNAKVRGLRPHAVYDVGYHKLVDVSVDR